VSESEYGLKSHPTQ